MLKISVFIICFFLILYHFKKIDEEKENFIAGIKQNKLEHFENDVPDINSLPRNVNPVSEESYETKIDETNNTVTNNTGTNNTVTNNTGTNNTVTNNTESNSTESNKGEVCQKKGENGEGCLFGCPENEVKEVETVERKTNLGDMLTTIEETEQICDMIEAKDRVRKEKEDKESLQKQIELNKKFLIQQRAQDKQIEDLEKMIKSMSFTQDMNKVAVEKCGKSEDECLSDKEKKLRDLLLQKQAKTRSVKINVNFKDFGKEFLGHLMSKVGLNSGEMKNLLNAVNSGALNLPELKNQVGYNNPKFNQYLDDSVNGCPTCKVDLSEYIDRCKIPCHKCRDPKWKCPQDTKN
jgi:hypothetical protein